MLNPYAIIAALLAFMASMAGSYSLGHSVASDHYESVINALRNEHTAKLSEKTQEALEATEKQIQTAQQLDRVNHEANQKINAALAVNRSTKLRYQSTVAHCRAVSKSSASSGSVSQTEIVEHELPKPLADDLFELAADADRLAAYAETCHNWVNSLSR